jgi:hypothetical protein
MKTFLHKFGCFVAATFLVLGFSGCDDDDGPSLTGDNTVYELDSRSNPGISGNVTFSKQTDNSILITIQLTGTQAGGNHPAHIHSDNSVDGGPIVIDLNNVDGSTGRSETVVTAFNDGTPVTYEELIEYDGHVNVHAAADNMSTLIAQGDIGENVLTGDSKTYPLASVSDPAIDGSVVFEERQNGEAVVTLMLEGTTAGNSHPAHIHNNSAAEGGGIAIDFTPVDGETGRSVTNINALNDGTPITYDDLLNFDGYVNVHLSSGDLGTLIAQGDIGGNELTGETVEYELGSMSDPGISGTATFAKRKNGFTLVTIQLTGTQDGNSHPSHIHNNSAAEGGGIAVDFKPIDGATGMSRTTIRKLNDDTPITYDELLDFNGYVNVHLSSSDLGTLIAQGDIGGNALTGESVEYPLNSVSDPNISGKVTFAKRKSGAALVTIELTGTTGGNTHPAHIHNNTAAEGGGIAVDFKPVDGETGISKTTIRALNDATPVTYDDLINFNGYVNVHLSSDNLGTLIAQGDIGQNALTEDKVEYVLNSVSDPSISGKATFTKRVNGTTLVTIQLEGTTAGGDHPAHIHDNSASETGPIAIDLSNVKGDTGRSVTQVTEKNDGTPITYDELIVYDGYINVHLSSGNLGTLIAQGDIGSNAE